MTSTYSVPGMTCQHCVDAVTEEVGAVDAVERVSVDLGTKIVTVDWTGESDDAAVRAAIDEAGYETA